MDNNVSNLKTEIEEIKAKLNILISNTGINKSNYSILLDVSKRIDTLIVEYMKNGGV